MLVPPPSKDPRCEVFKEDADCQIQQDKGHDVYSEVERNVSKLEKVSAPIIEENQFVSVVNDNDDKRVEEELVHFDGLSELFVSVKDAEANANDDVLKDAQ